MNSAAPSAAYTASVVPLVPLNVRFRKSRSGSIGCELRALDDEERGDRADADEARHDLRRADAVVALDQRPTQRRRARRAARTAPDPSIGCSVSARDSGTWRTRDHDRDDRDRDVDEEHPPPRERVDQPAAEERADRARDAREPRPRADRAARGRRRGTTSR